MSGDLQARPVRCGRSDGSATRGEFPTSVHVGDAPPPFYEETDPLAIPLPEDELLEINFAGGEAWYEELQFTMSDLRTDRVLTFDRRLVTPDAFTSQQCEQTS